MRIVISSGHGLNIQGADEIVNEVEEARKVVNRVAEMLTSAGVWVAVFHDNTSNEQNENLEAICDFHNSQTRDLDVSVHFNMYNGEAHGTEVFATSQLELARDVASEIAINSGLTDRGGKDGSHLYFINHTEEGAILIEVCFIDHQGDVDKYHRYFEDICQAIAETVGSISIDDAPPQPPDHERPPRPQWPDRPEDVPVGDRPTLRQGDRGDDVLDMQRMIPQFTGEFDGDFGPTTYDNVIRYQRSRGLEADGICGSATWESLYSHAPPVPLPPLPPGALTAEQQAVIIRIANGSEIADYSWHDRGVAPTGFTQGMALAFGQTYKNGKPIIRRRSRCQRRGRTQIRTHSISIVTSSTSSTCLTNETARTLCVIFMRLCWGMVCARARGNIVRAEIRARPTCRAIQPRQDSFRLLTMPTARAIRNSTT